MALPLVIGLALAPFAEVIESSKRASILAGFGCFIFAITIALPTLIANLYGKKICPKCNWGMFFGKDKNGNPTRAFSTDRTCPNCGIDLTKPTTVGRISEA